MMNQNPIFSNREAYRFIKVQKYFERYKEWEKLGQLQSYKMNYPQNNVLTLNFTSQSGKPLAMLIYFVQDDTFRVKFNPMRNNAQEYSLSNPYNIIKKNFQDLQKCLKTQEYFRLQFEEKRDCIIIKTIRKTKIKSKSSPKISESEDQKHFKESPVMTVKITKPIFGIQIYNCLNCQDYLVWKTADIPIYFTPNGNQDYAIIQSIFKPATAKYIGFGQQGGHCLSKNTAQANYFNFDNMRYMQVYNQGPLDNREPLYHSDPIFFQYNGVPQKNNVNCIFVDNPGQILVDVGYINSHRYMFGTRFGDLDYYYFLGNDTSSIIQSLTAIIGRSELKPRYILGYHQGCYGYDSRSAAEWVVNKYRQYKIPLDGLHVDVDIQHNYQTFTIDTTKFPNPKQFFGNLRKLGVKCSTNITPVISCIDPNYSTYKQGLQKGYFVLDKRHNASDYEADHYQCFGGGNQYQNYLNDHDKQTLGFNSGRPYIGGVYYGNDAHGNQLGTPGHYPDLDRQQVRDWWGKQYQYLFDCGLQMVWQDMTTPAIRETRGDMKGFPFRLMLNRQSDYEPGQVVSTMAIKIWNQYSYNLHRATFDGLNRLPGRQNKRNFIIGRGSFTGSSKFAGLWTGDNASEWDFLRMNVSQALSLGMSGVLINGQDIGGFQCSNLDGGKWPSPELLIRWTAAGAFLPWFRNHYVRKGRKEFQQPFMYVEWFNQYKGGQIPQPQDLYRMVLPICKHYIQLRYKLMQLFYDTMFKNQFNGLPICRPMFINSPHDKALFNDKEKFLSNQFYVGRDLLVAPILWPQVEHGIDNHGKRDIYLPCQCGWYCYMNNIMPLGSMVEGGTTVRDFDANINMQGNHIHFIVPMYVREGGIIPTIQPEQYVGQRKQKGIPNYITINIYPGKSGKYSMFLDDGVSRQSSPYLQEWGLSKAIQKNKYQHVKIHHEYLTKNTRKVFITKKHNQYTPDQKYYFVAILLDPSEKKITSVELEILKLSQVVKPQSLRMLYSTGETSPQTMQSQSEDEQKAGLVKPVSQSSPLMAERSTGQNQGQSMMRNMPQVEQIKKTASKEKIPNPEHALLYRGQKVCQLDQICEGSLQERINKFMTSTADYNCWYYNETIRIAYIKLEDRPQWKAIGLKLTYGV